MQNTRSQPSTRAQTKAIHARSSPDDVPVKTPYTGINPQREDVDSGRIPRPSDKQSSSEYPSYLRGVKVCFAVCLHWRVADAYLHAQETHALSITLFLVEHLKVLVDDGNGK